MRRNLILTLLWLAIINGFALLALNRYNLKPDTAYSWTDNPGRYVQQQGWSPLAALVHWDANWYLGLAREGYVLVDSAESNVAFLPFYPLLIRLVALPLWGNLVLAAWLVNVASLLLAVAIFTRLVVEFHPTFDRHEPVIFLLIFPTAFFLNAVYTESLFLFLSLATFLYARRANFTVASAFGCLAALTRISGALLFITLLMEYRRRYGSFIPLKPELIATLLVPLGSLALFFVHTLAFGDPLLFFKMQARFGRTLLQLQREHFTLFSNPAIVNLTLDVAFLGFGVVLAFLAFRRLPPSYGVYMFGSIVLAISTGTLISIGRFLLTLFPIYLILSSLKHQVIKQAFALGSILLLGMYTTLFVNAYWAG